MSDRYFFNISIPDNIDSALTKGVERALKEKKAKKLKRIKIFFTSTAASICLLIVFGATNPALATRLPIVGSVFEAIEKNIHFPGNYSQYSTSINKTTYSNNINVTLSDILCDGQNLYVTYVIENSKPFKYTSWGEKPLDRNQMLTYEAYNKVSFSNKELDNTGFAGLEGKFLDEKTFIGMEKYDLNSLRSEVPEEFDFQVKLTGLRMKALNDKDKDQIFKGTWAFKIPVKVDRSLTRTIDVNTIENKGFKINSISITPFELRVKVSGPKGDYLNIRVYDEKGNEFVLDMGKRKDNTETIIFKAPPKDCGKIRVVLYKDILEKVDTIENNGQIETTYKSIGNEIFIDEVISIKE